MTGLYFQLWSINSGYKGNVCIVGGSGQYVVWAWSVRIPTIVSVTETRMWLWILGLFGCGNRFCCNKYSQCSCTSVCSYCRVIYFHNITPLVDTKLAIIAEKQTRIVMKQTKTIPPPGNPPAVSLIKTPTYTSITLTKLHSVVLNIFHEPALLISVQSVSSNYCRKDK